MGGGEEEVEVEYVGSRGARKRRLSEVVRGLNLAAKEEDMDDVMGLEAVDDLSDTETVFFGGRRGGEEEMEVEFDVVVVEDLGEGTAEDPYVL
jgi:hypothetical protein